MSRDHVVIAAAALVAALVAALGAALAPLPALAAPPTCQGQPATHVGERGDVVFGTEGPDVIVVNGANEVHALGGDDLICSATTDNGSETSILAGEGDDAIDTTGNVGVATAADLGPGDDTYLGGDEADFVLGPLDPAAEGHDTISTGRGNDMVDTGGVGADPDADSVDLGGGNDTLVVRGSVDQAVWDAGPGADQIVFARFLQGGAWVVDNAEGRLTRDGVPVAQWSSVGGFVVESGRSRDISVLGGDGPERVRSLVGLDQVQLGGGDDVLELSAENLAGESAMALRGGTGDDLLALGIGYTSGAVDLHLGRGQLRFVRPGRVGATSTVRGFNRARAVASWARVVGTGGPDRISWNACRGEVSGAGGSDVLAYLTVEEDTCGDGGDLTVYGGSGDDRLIGGRLADRLVGGLGRDSADGRRGRDLCRAETVVRCER